MSSIDLIKESIYCDTIVRKDEYINSSTKSYYDDLLRALSIDDFPLIEINTINKRTYMCESISDKRYYLVFDYYFLDCLHEINQIIMAKHGKQFLDSFLNKTLAEECYCNRRYALSIRFATEYMNTIEDVIKEYNKESDFNDSHSNTLFIQQAFLIAHELFHYVLNNDSSLLSKGMEKKRNFINSMQDASLEDLVTKHVKDDFFIEECICDATGVIQAIEIARSLGKMSIAEAASASAMAIMGQITVTTIQEAAKRQLHFSSDTFLEKSNARLMHFLAFVPQYITEYFSVDESRQFMQESRSMYSSWLLNIQSPTIEKLITHRKAFEKDLVRDSSRIEDWGSAKQVLIQIFNI